MIRRAMRPPALLLLVTLAGAAALDAQVGGAYRARLAPVPIDVAMQATIAGSGSVTASLAGASLVVNGAFKDLRTPATVVRLHRGPKMGMRGPAIADLSATPGTSGTITGKVDLTAAQVDDLAGGRLYVQLHSEKAPAGNLWGWLLPEGKK